MSMPRNEIQRELSDAWRTFMDSLEKSMTMLEKDIEEASQMAGICTSEWCAATEHVIDELANALFSISEPRFTNPDESKRLKALKHRVHDIYANYREVYKKAA